MVFDARERPAYSPTRVNRALVTNGRIDTRQGCMGLSHINNEYPFTDDMNNRIKGSCQGWNPTASRQCLLPRSMCYRIVESHCCYNLLSSVHTTVQMVIVKRMELSREHNEISLTRFASGFVFPPEERITVGWKQMNRRNCSGIYTLGIIIITLVKLVFIQTDKHTHKHTHSDTHTHTHTHTREYG